MTWVYVTVATLILFVLFLLKPARPTAAQKQPFMHRNFAHRGLYNKDQSIPENSIPAFDAACKNGYGIEFDIQFSAEGEIVVFHDDTLDRMCNIHGRVDDYTWQQLKEMPLKQTAYNMPLFTEVLKLVNGKVPLIIELKSGKNNNLLCSKASEILKEYNGDFCIESFDTRIVRWFKKNQKHILRGQLSAPANHFKQLKKPVAFCLGHLFCNVMGRPNFIAYNTQKSSPFAKLAEGMGAMTVVWTVHPDDNIKFMQESNDAVIFEYYTPEIKY